MNAINASLGTEEITKECASLEFSVSTTGTIEVKK
jgi:hypothetical protein